MSTKSVKITINRSNILDYSVNNYQECSQCKCLLMKDGL